MDIQTLFVIAKDESCFYCKYEYHKRFCKSYYNWNKKELCLSKDCRFDYGSIHHYGNCVPLSKLESLDNFFYKRWKSFADKNGILDVRLYYSDTNDLRESMVKNFRSGLGLGCEIDLKRIINIK